MAKTKDNAVVTTAWDAATQTLTFTVLGVGDLPLHLSNIAQVNRVRSEIHGWKQRIVDAAAIKSDDTPIADPRAADPATERERVATEIAAQAKRRAALKHEAMAKVVAHYESGSEDWALVRDSTGPGLDATLIRAVMEVTGKDETQVRALIAANAERTKTTPRAYLAVLGTGARVAEVANRMRAEGTTIDPEDELAGMMADEAGSDADGSNA